MKFKLHLPDGVTMQALTVDPEPVPVTIGFDYDAKLVGFAVISIEDGECVADMSIEAGAAVQELDGRYAVRSVGLVNLPRCAHQWEEQPGEPPIDVCPSCGAVRR